MATTSLGFVYCDHCHARVQTRQCSRCTSTTPLHWVETPDGLRLHDADHNVHYMCGEAKSIGYRLPNLPVDASVLEKVDSASNQAGKALDAALAVATQFSNIGLRFNALASEVAKWEQRIDATRKVEHVFRLAELPEWEHSGRLHPAMDDLMLIASAREPAYLRGPAGSGKTTGCVILAEALRLPFSRQGINMQTSKVDIFGAASPITHEYKPSATRERFEHGGVLLWDELDRGLPGMMTVLNTIADDAPVTWPDGWTGTRHKDCVIIAAGNTYGRGADDLYVGANRLDAASLDRFSYIDWDYDWDLTAEISGNERWTRQVQSWYVAASKRRLKVVIGPRAAIKGAKFLAAGASEDQVAQWTVWAPIGEDHKRTILAETVPV